MSATATRPGTGEPGLAYLEGRLALLWERVQALVGARRATDAHPDDRFRGLYVSDDQVDEVLAGPPPGEPVDPTRTTGPASRIDALEAAAAEAEAAGADIRLRRLGRAFGLDRFDENLLIAAAAPDLDPRFERLYAYLNDDVSRRRATVGLLLELCGVAASHGAARARLAPRSPLAAGSLVEVDDPERPLLGRAVRVPDRVTAFLLGDDEAPTEVVRISVPWVEARVGSGEPLLRAVEAGARTLYVREATGTGALSWAGTTLAAAGIAAVAVDLGAAADEEDQGRLAAVARREALLRGAVLLASDADLLAGPDPRRLRAWTEGPGVVVLTGSTTWDPRWSLVPPALLEAPHPTRAERQAQWAALSADGTALTPEEWGTLAAYRLTPEQVLGAVRTARHRAAMAASPVTLADLQAGARAQNSSGLERLARRIAPTATFDDLVAPPHVVEQLRAIASRMRHREAVLDGWGMASSAARGRGVTALFAGDSGTGKTMSAEVMAAALGLDLYVIDLSTVVDKYVGETEKNLDRIFREAEKVNGVLLFDEADAIFGKRSEVKDAQDRYANVEIAYLLQRMEQFEGIAILTTNLRANVDEAFLRRLDVLVDFPVPDAEARAELWRRQLGPSLPVAGDLDLDFLAGSFRLSGGNIRNVALAAAFAAAEEGGPVSMAHLVRATAGEYRKLGRLCVPSEFGPYYPLVER